MPDPAPLSAFEHVYAGPQATIDAERDSYAAYLESFEDGSPGGLSSGDGPAAEPQPRGTGAFEREGEVR